MKEKVLLFITGFIVCAAAFLFSEDPGNKVTDFFSFTEGKLYENNFDLSGVNNWNLDSSWGIVSENDNSFLRGTKHDFACYKPSYPWTDYTILLKLRVKGAVHINVRQKEGPFMRYFLGIESGNCYLSKQIAEDFFDLINTDANLSTSWNIIEIQVKNNNVKLKINETLMINYTDREMPLLYGGFSFECLEDSTVDIDDVSITGIITEQKNKWIKTGGPPGGLGYDVRIHPRNKKIMFVSDNPSGVNKSLDSGNTWRAANYGITVRGGSSDDAIPVFCLTIDPNNPDIIWTGTQNMRGIFKSIDCGDTWTRMDNGITEWNEITFRGFAVKPGDSNVVFAGAEISTSKQGREFNCTKGKIYKTVNGGKNWSPVWEGDNLARIIIFDPENPKILYASTGIFDREAWNTKGEGVLKSTNGGKTWKQINKGLENLFIGFLEMHPQNRKILMCAAGNNQYHKSSGAYRTMNSGKTWQKVLDTSPSPLSIITFSPSHPNIVYAGSAEAIYCSKDGGNTWKKYYKEKEWCWGPSGIRAGVPISAVVDPDDPYTLFVNNYGGGVFKSTVGAQTWVDCSKGYTGVDLRKVVVNPGNPDLVYTIGRSGPFMSTDGGVEWTGLSYSPAAYPEWACIQINPSNPKIILCSDEHAGDMLRSTDQGMSWELVVRNRSGESDGVKDRHCFKAIEFAPSNPQVVYAGMKSMYLNPNPQPSYGMYTSTDSGITWKRINTGLESTDKNIQCISIHPQKPEIAYIGTVSNGVFKTTDGGKKWYPVSHGLMSENVLSLLIHPDDPETLFAGLGQGIGLYKTTNGGKQWQPANEGLVIECPSYLQRIGQVEVGMSLDKPKRIMGTDYIAVPWTAINNIVMDPRDHTIIYLSDYHKGVYLSINGGKTWMPMIDGLDIKAVTSLSMSGDGSVLYAATSGGGVYKLFLR